MLNGTNVFVDPIIFVIKAAAAGAYLGFCQGGCTFLADLPLPPPPPDLDVDPDPHQNNADPQPWAQLSKDCCLIYNYMGRTKYAACASKLHELSGEYLRTQKTQGAAVFFIRKNLGGKMI